MTEKTNSTGSEELAFSAEDFTPEELSGNEPIKDVTAEVKDEAKDVQDVEKHKIKYNGKEEEYSIEELITLAQKGRNYDHVLGERDSLKNSEEMSILSKMAKDAGKKDVKEFLKDLSANIENVKLEERVKQLENEGMNPEHARRMAELEMKNTAQPQADEASDIQPLVKQFEELFQEFPETQDWKELSDYPQEVQDLISDGKSPLVAYTKYLTKKAEDEKRVLEQNKQAQERDTGSFKTGKSETKDDDFLKGLFG